MLLNQAIWFLLAVALGLVLTARRATANNQSKAIIVLFILVYFSTEIPLSPANFPRLESGAPDLVQIYLTLGSASSLMVFIYMFFDLTKPLLIACVLELMQVLLNIIAICFVIYGVNMALLPRHELGGIINIAALLALLWNWYNGDRLISANNVIYGRLFSVDSIMLSIRNRCYHGSKEMEKKQK